MTDNCPHMQTRITFFEINSQGLASLFFNPIDSNNLLGFIYHRCGAYACPKRLLLILSYISFPLLHFNLVGVSIETSLL